MAVGVLKNIFLQVVNNQVHSWLTAALTVPSPSTWSQFHKTLSTSFGAWNTNFGTPNTKIGVPDPIIQFSISLNKFWCFRHHPHLHFFLDFLGFLFFRSYIFFIWLSGKTRDGRIHLLSFLSLISFQWVIYKIIF